MTRILQLESSTTMCTVALAVNGQCVDFMEIHDGYSHAERLAPFVAELLERNDLNPAEIQAVAVSKGPGSYTGLRIGTSLAKGLCYSIGIPLIGVPTLAIMCRNELIVQRTSTFSEALLCPMLDARRMEVYCGIYGNQGALVMPDHAKIIDQQSFEDLLDDHPIIFFGPGSQKVQGVVTSPNAHFIENVWPMAADMSAIAFQSFMDKEWENLTFFEPSYLKEFFTGSNTC